MVTTVRSINVSCPDRRWALAFGRARRLSGTAERAPDRRGSCLTNVKRQRIHPQLGLAHQPSRPPHQLPPGPRRHRHPRSAIDRRTPSAPAACLSAPASADSRAACADHGVTAAVSPRAARDDDGDRSMVPALIARPSWSFVPRRQPSRRNRRACRRHHRRRCQTVVPTTTSALPKVIVSRDAE